MEELMKPESEATLLRIFIGESDLYQHSALHEVIVKKAREMGLAGATVIRGILSYGASSHFRSNRILDLSSDLPLIVEIVDTEAKITTFRPVLDALLEESRCGGLVTSEPVKIVRYSPGK